MLQGRPDLTAYEKPDAGFTIRVVPPGQPSGLHHAESVQEDFLILMGESVLIIENQERHLRTPDGTWHSESRCAFLIGLGRGFRSRSEH